MPEPVTGWFARALFCAALLPISCSAPAAHEEPIKVYLAGEQATAGPLTYAVVNSRIVQRLGEDMQTARFPQNRFYIIQIRVSNGSGSTIAIPALALLDDSGKTWDELSDGTGVENWLGVVRSVGPTQVTEGVILFDAPARHYRLRVTEEFDRPEVAIDMPLDLTRDEREPMPVPAVPASR